MSRLGTVREGLQDNPLRLLVVARSVFVVLAGTALALDSAWRLARYAGLHVSAGDALELSRSVVSLGFTLVGILAEFTSYRVARAVNLAFYTGYAVWLWFIPVHLAAELVWYLISAVFAATLWGLYLATSPQHLRSTDAV